MILLERRFDLSLLDRFKAHPPARRFLLAANPPKEVSILDILTFRDYSFLLRYTDVGGMFHWAELATLLADAVCARRPEDQAYRASQDDQDYQDARAEAWCQKGNSLRILAHFPEAEAAFHVAEEVLHLGTGNPLLAARLWEFRGSLYQDWRRFESAQPCLAQAQVLYQKAGAESGLTRCLIVEAMAAAKNHNPVRGARLAEWAMQSVDPCLDPLLAASIAHTLAWCLVDQRRARDARAVYSSTEPLFDELRHEPLVQAHRHWLVAHIDSALALLGSAEAQLRRASEAFALAGLSYEEALVSLDLAAALARQRRLAEAISTVEAVQSLFAPLGITPDSTVAQRLRIETLPTTVGAMVQTLELATREINVQPMPRREIPPVLD
jgi:tetratricopeptide (TPR) repeat protein